MLNDLKIYLREELEERFLTEEEFHRLLLEDYEPYPYTDRGNGRFTFSVDLDVPNINWHENGRDCEITGTTKMSLDYTITIVPKDDKFGQKIGWIAFDADKLGYSKGAGADFAHLSRVIKTVMDAAVKVSERSGIRFFEFGGASDARSKSCRNKKVKAITSEEGATLRSRFYVRAAEGKAKGSAAMNGNSVTVDMAKMSPERFPEENLSECAKFGIKLQDEKVDGFAQAAIGCNGDRVTSYARRITVLRNKKIEGDMNKYFDLTMDRNYNVTIKTTSALGTHEPMSETFPFNDLWSATEKIVDLIDNPVVEVDLSKTIKKIAEMLTSKGFSIVEESDEGDVYGIKLKFQLDEEGSYVEVIMIDNEDNKIHLKLREMEYDDGEIEEGDTDEMENTNPRKLYDKIMEFTEELDDLYGSATYIGLSKPQKIQYLSNKPNSELEAELIFEIYGKPIHKQYAKGVGYDIRYKTKLPNGTILYEDLISESDSRHYRYVIRVMDTVSHNRNQIHFKVYDSENFGEMIRNKEEVSAEFNNSLNESKNAIKTVFRKNLKNI